MLKRYSTPHQSLEHRKIIPTPLQIDKDIQPVKQYVIAWLIMAKQIGLRWVQHKDLNRYSILTLVNPILTVGRQPSHKIISIAFLK